MSAEVAIVKREIELTVNDRTIEITKGWSGELVTVQVPSYTIATVPDVDPAGQIIFISDMGNGTLAYSNGTNWIS